MRVVHAVLLAASVVLVPAMNVVGVGADAQLHAPRIDAQMLPAEALAPVQGQLLQEDAFSAWQGPHDVRRRGCQTVLVLGFNGTVNKGFGLYDAVNLDNEPGFPVIPNRWNTYLERETASDPRDFIMYDPIMLRWVLFWNKQPRYARFSSEAGPVPSFPPFKHWKSLLPNDRLPAPLAICNDLYPPTYYDMPDANASRQLSGAHAQLMSAAQAMMKKRNAVGTGCRSVQLIGTQQDGNTIGMGVYDLFPGRAPHTWGPFIKRGTRFEQRSFLVFNPENLVWVRAEEGSFTHFFKFPNLDNGPPPPSPPTTPWQSVHGGPPVVPVCSDLFPPDNPDA